MSSTNTYTEQKYCVYITHYSGNLLPSNYIGSSTVNKINTGYRGSVTSKKYKSIWEIELKTNTQLFSTDIISTHDTRREATYKELQLQRIFNVVKSDLFVNMAYASVNGFFGRDTSGKNYPLFGKRGILNPNYGKSNNGASVKLKNKTFSQESKDKMSNSAKGKPKSQTHRKAKMKKYKCISPENIIYNTSNLIEFCTINDLSPTLMYAVCSGRRNHHKNWKCEKFT